MLTRLHLVRTLPMTVNRNSVNNEIVKKEFLVGVRLDEATHAELMRLAAEDDRTLSYMGRKLIEEALKARRDYGSRKGQSSILLRDDES